MMNNTNTHNLEKGKSNDLGCPFLIQQHIYII